MRRTGIPSWLSVRRGEPTLGSKADNHVVAPPPAALVWAVGGGKGGIGKSFLVANLATVAARCGKRVILIDADLGGANLHTCLGVRAGERVSLSDYLEDRVLELDKVAIETPVAGLRLILGALGHTGKAETTAEQRSALLRAVRKLPADLVIFDLAAGTDRSTIDFFLEADEGFVVTTPEPTAIENAYAFLRAAFYRKLSHELAESTARDVIRLSMDQRNERGIRTPSDLLVEIDRIDKLEGERFRRVIESFKPHLVVNQVRDSEEVKMGFSIRSVCKKYFGIDVDYAGYICFDDNVWRSVKQRQPLVLAYPSSDGALYIRRIVKKLLGT
ncbi:MAG: MinD/ParA family protein [Deltaproteobacteria bacterium]|nr:MinD/ParA family protein [Deltaproteobacteria bacterium]